MAPLYQILLCPEPPQIIYACMSVCMVLTLYVDKSALVIIHRKLINSNESLLALVVF